MKSPLSKSVRLLQEKYQENLEVMLKNLLKDETLSDITLHCRDGAVRAHRVILAASSPYFRKVFQEHPEHQVAFLLHGITVKHLKSLVELMYRGSTQIPSEMTNKLCDIAEEFGMKGIVDENDKSLLNTSGRDTRYKGQKRVTVDFGNDSSDAQIRKCPRTSQERRISGCSDKSVKKDNPWASTPLSPPTLDSLGLVPTAIKQEPQSPVSATTSLLMTTPTAHMTAEVRRRNNWAMKQRKYKCTLCPASFKRASHLTRHQLVHTGERPYACEQCDKAFSRHDKLKHHIRKAHTLEYEYVGNMIDSSTEGDCYTIGHVSMDMPSSSTDMTDERRTHVTREDLLARMKVKVETPEPETMPEVPKLSPVPQASLPKPDVTPPEPVIAAATSDASITGNADESISGASSSVGSAAGTSVQKKGRGRPRKYPPVPRPLIKRPRGRPRLNQSVPPMQPGYKPIESARRSDNYDITNMPFGDLEYLTKSLQMEQNSESFEETNNSIEPSFMEPLVEIELDQNSSKKREEEEATEDEEDERETVLHHDTAGSFLQNIGLLENSNVNKMEIGECTISVSSAPPE